MTKSQVSLFPWQNKQSAKLRMMQWLYQSESDVKLVIGNTENPWERSLLNFKVVVSLMKKLVRYLSLDGL